MKINYFFIGILTLSGKNKFLHFIKFYLIEYNNVEDIYKNNQSFMLFLCPLFQ